MNDRSGTTATEDIEQQCLGASVPKARTIEKIIVAIHGVGNQRRSDTVRTVAHRVGALSKPPLPVMPLGFFSVGNAGEVHVSELDVDANHPLWNVGFAEVYWADVPRGVVTQGDTLEESKAWGRTIVGRAQANYRKQVSQDGCKLTDVDFSQVAGVTEEIIEAVALMENLLWLFGKAGLFKFDLAPLLTDYIGDVQLVAEFQSYRRQIVDRFHDAMNKILRYLAGRKMPRPQIYVIAHSEGTVISFLAMLEALSLAKMGNGVVVPDGQRRYDWIGSVRGFMTIGSPIDKHLLLWPNLWPSRQQMNPDADSPRIKLSSPIKWRNYYDYGDPIGFQLDTARDYLKRLGCEAFEFDATLHDRGFSRYPLPGKAHTDYWQDTKLFRHFFEDVVLADATQPSSGASQCQPRKPPRSTLYASVISLAVPYVLALLLHIGAVYVMFKATITFLAQPWWNLHDTVACVSALSILLACVTVAGRLPRLVKRSQVRWWLLSAAIFAAGTYASMSLLPSQPIAFLAKPLAQLTLLPDAGASDGTTLLVGACIVVAASGWLVPRWPRAGRPLMVALGALLVASAIGVGYNHVPDGKGPQLWPLILSAMIFIYLWWLGIVLFDLTFIWHRYIRNSVALDTLRDWRAKADTTPRTFGLRKSKS